MLNFYLVRPLKAKPKVMTGKPFRLPRGKSFSHNIYFCGWIFQQGSINIHPPHKERTNLQRGVYVEHMFLFFIRAHKCSPIEKCETPCRPAWPSKEMWKYVFRYDLARMLLCSNSLLHLYPRAKGHHPDAPTSGKAQHGNIARRSNNWARYG